MSGQILAYGSLNVDYLASNGQSSLISQKITLIQCTTIFQIATQEVKKHEVSLIEFLITFQSYAPTESLVFVR